MEDNYSHMPADIGSVEGCMSELEKTADSGVPQEMVMFSTA